LPLMPSVMVQFRGSMPTFYRKDSDFHSITYASSVLIQQPRALRSLHQFVFKLEKRSYLLLRRYR
jgi:hypothetical protein